MYLLERKGMVNLDYSDQSKIFDAKTWGWPVHLIGAGGITNMLGLILAKMGVREIHVWDDDVLEARNCPTEVAYSYQMVGHPKVEAMAEAIAHLMGDNTKVYQHQERVTAETELPPGVVVCGVDSMASRKVIWENVKNNFWNVPLFIDGRSAGEVTAIFAFAPADLSCQRDYETWLFDDSKAMKLQCGARNIGYISAYMAAEIARIITRYHRGLEIEFQTQHNFGR